MASAIAELIAGKLSELAVNEATLLWNFKDDVDGMRKTMEKMKARMLDADERSWSRHDGHQARLWTKEFKSAAYDVGDLLDMFEAIERIKKSQSKIKLFFQFYNPLLLRFTMSHKMKKVKEALLNIEEQGHDLQLLPRNTPTWANENSYKDTIFSTSRGVDVGMVGRGAQKEKLMKLLLESKAEEEISIIPIYGIGGSGKTKLAQEVFSDNRSKVFDLRIWVYVSEKFDLLKIGKIILSAVNRSMGSGTSEKYVPPQNGDLHTIIEQLEHMLPTKRYLIVLDDIWEEGIHNLENLKHMLQHGRKRSKVIITTRMDRIVEILDIGVLANQGIIRPVHKSDWIELKKLSDEDCWNVMHQAFRRDVDLSGVEEIGREIAKKCVGLPLLARSLGFVMSQYNSREAWEDIRDREIILDMKEDQVTLQSLMLSYYYLPFEMKLCFTYCAVFSKGFTITKDHLIQQWRALGYIHRTIDGHNCVNYLSGMSFLDILKSSQSAVKHAAAPDNVTMHDLVYDLARTITDNELVILDASERMDSKKFEKDYIRHMRLVKSQKQSRALKEFPAKIRSLQFTECSAELLQQNAFSKSKYLRVLDLSGCSIDGGSPRSNILLPSSIHHLILLRYLDASDLPIPQLPKSFHKLQNMQTLILSNCSLESLPDSISTLLEICYLDLSGNSRLNELPVSLGNLCVLWFLKLSGCSSLKELPETIHKLESLRHLDMSRCCALHRLPDKFGSLSKLLFLNLSSCSKLVKLPDNINLGSLEHLNLSGCHDLQNLPQDFGNLHNLKFLNLSECYEVQMLPESFCQLKVLKELDLSDCQDLKELPECFGKLSELHSLNLTSCSKLQLLPESFCNLSKLKHLNLSCCASLEKLDSSLGNLKLQTLDLSGCLTLALLPDNVRKMTSLTRLLANAADSAVTGNSYTPSSLRLPFPGRRLHYVGQSGTLELGTLTSCTDLDIGQLQCLEHPEDAERAKLRDRTDLRGLALHWSHGMVSTEKVKFKEMDAKTMDLHSRLVLERLIPPRTLENMELFGYMSKDFPGWMFDISTYLPCLGCIELYDLKHCDSLPPFGQLPNLRILDMTSMPSIKKVGKKFYRRGGTCKKLRVIRLHVLENLAEWWTTWSGEDEEEFLIPNLHLLRVTHCPKLKFLPYPPKSMHWNLFNSDKMFPLHGFGRLSSSTLPVSTKLHGLKNFSTEHWGAAQHLGPTLETLDLEARSSLRTFPDVAPCFSSLRHFSLYLPDLEVLPEWLWQLNYLEKLHIGGCRILSSLPDSIQNLTALKELHITSCPELTSFPDSIQNLTALKNLRIYNCPRLSQWCQGEGAHRISHIPHRYRF